MVAGLKEVALEVLPKVVEEAGRKEHPLIQYKPGVQSSEFWLSLATIAVTFIAEVSGHLKDETIGIAAIAGAVVYSLARSWLKSKPSKSE